MEKRGYAYLENLNYELAENDFKKAYEIDEDKAYQLQHWDNFKKKLLLSIKHYLEALKIDPKNYGIYADTEFR